MRIRFLGAIIITCTSRHVRGYKFRKLILGAMKSQWFRRFEGTGCAVTYARAKSPCHDICLGAITATAKSQNYFIKKKNEKKKYILRMIKLSSKNMFLCFSHTIHVGNDNLEIFVFKTALNFTYFNDIFYSSVRIVRKTKHHIIILYFVNGLP